MKADSFERRVEKITESGCWLWLGSVDKDGYGILERCTKAHRRSYEIYKGKFPRQLLVCHTCDIPCCVNPAHLFLGTRQDNQSDMARKKRSTLGVRNPRAKLTEANINEIRELLKRGRYHYEIARMFGVTRAAITAINTGINWGQK